MNSNNKNVLILGAYGRLGSSLSNQLAKDFNIYRVGRDISSEVHLDEITTSSLIEVLSKNNIGVIINLIACTDIAECERNPINAFMTNAVIPKYIVDAANETNKNIFIVHISSDQVYSGLNMHNEDQINPCNIYAASKLAGEIPIRSYINSCVLRTNYFGISTANNKNSFLDWLVDSINSSKEITIFKNVFFSPVGCNSLCNLINRIISIRLIGLYNFGSSKQISKADFAIMTAKILGAKETKFKINDYFSNENIVRPLNMSMDSTKILKELKMDPLVIRNELINELNMPEE